MVLFQKRKRELLSVVICPRVPMKNKSRKIRGIYYTAQLFFTKQVEGVDLNNSIILRLKA